MKCPYCGNAMEPGNIFGRIGVNVTWYPAGKHAPLLYSTKTASAQGGIQLSSPGDDSIFGSRLCAHICKTCSIGLFKLPVIKEIKEME